MKRGLDLSTITKTERVILALGVALFLNALIPWWYRVETPRQTFLHNGGLFGWGIAAALAGFLSAGIVVTRHLRSSAAFADRAWHLILGAIATGGLALHGSRTSGAVWIGFWVEASLAAALTGAGVARIRERRRGWV